MTDCARTLLGRFPISDIVKAEGRLRLQLLAQVLLSLLLYREVLLMTNLLLITIGD
jgi:hypothetical protein